MPKRVIVVAHMKCAAGAIASMPFPKFFSVHNISPANNTKLGLNHPPPPKGVQTAITNFVAVVDAPALACDSQDPIPNPGVPILLRAPPSRSRPFRTWPSLWRSWRVANGT